MPLGLIDLFPQPYEIWNTRDATFDELMALGRYHAQMPTTLKVRITDAVDAATYVAGEGTDQRLRNYINDFLDSSEEHRAWRRSMPSATPTQIATYQKAMPRCNLSLVSQEIGEIGQVLSPGQRLFHAGVWPQSGLLTTNRPLSTSFCPDVALRNAEHRGKAYHSGRIDLLVLEAYSPATPVFVYRRKGTTSGHENEVLFAAGAQVTITGSNPVRADYPVSSDGINRKLVAIYVHTALIC